MLAVQLAFSSGFVKTPAVFVNPVAKFAYELIAVAKLSSLPLHSHCLGPVALRPRPKVMEVMVKV
jgi:sorbitol-specific phosphotransferase system component IIBC